jgi:hypothetical protein
MEFVGDGRIPLVGSTADPGWGGRIMEFVGDGRIPLSGSTAGPAERSSIGSVIASLIASLISASSFAVNSDGVGDSMRGRG